MRTDAGPRDWTPGGETYVPMMTGRDSTQAPRIAERRRRSPLGLLALFAGATALFAEVALLLRPDVDFWPHVFLAPLALILGIVALAKLGSLGAINRVGAVLGATLGTVATLVLAASMTGILDGVHTLDAPWPPTPAQVAAQADALAAESAGLSAAATSLSTLLLATHTAAGTYPLTLEAELGAVALPEGTRVAYTSDGATYALLLTGELGAVAQLDSVRGVVLTSTLSP